MRIHLLPIFIALAALLASCGGSQGPIQASDFEANWQANAGAQTAWLGDSVIFDAEGSFTSLAQGKAMLTGSWSFDQGSLTMKALQEQNQQLDSVFLEVQGGKPIVRIPGDRGTIDLAGGGYQGPMKEAIFRASRNDDGGISLENSDGKASIKQPKVVFERPEPVGFNDIIRALIGVLFILTLAWLLSSKRKAINWRLVGVGMLLQLTFAVLVLKVPFVKDGFAAVASIFVKILGFTQAGSSFVFGNIITDMSTFGFIFAFQVLPTIVFFSAVTSLLYYLGVLQKIVYGFAWVMARTMGLSGAESMAAAGNIFLGQTEAPLLIKPYLDRMTRSEILCLMGGGMATIAGSVFAAYVLFLGGTDVAQQEFFATQLLTASIMNAPAAIVIAKMLLPETETVDGNLDVSKEKIGSNVLDAIANGASEGLRLAVNVAMMLIVFIAFVAAINFILGEWIGSWTGLNDYIAASTGGKYLAFNLEFIFGFTLAPVAWLLGVPSEDMMMIGQLLGQKISINEFVAYEALGTAKANGTLTNYKSIIIGTYVLCGFANISSIGIQIGGIGALAPSQRKTLSELGVKALIVGTLAAFLTAAWAGVLA
ncbi:MAG: NupC/NupG family nucleoside CNT transporter [Bacteroidia bacterium]